MEAGGKDCEEETLQSAFKKLRVDAESLPGAVSVSEALVPRAASRPCPDTSGAKPKLSCPKDNWHGCMRKSSRGASRTQRRRRSKSPILHPPKFTYCSAAAASALSLTSGCLKHQRLAVPNPEPPPAVDRRAASPAPRDPSSSSGHISPLAFGLCAGYERQAGASPQDNLGVTCSVAVSLGQDGGGDVQLSKTSAPEESACGGAEAGAAAAAAAAAAAQTPGTTEASDFRALSQLHSSSSAEGPLTACACRKSSDPREAGGQGTECQCQSSHPGWAGVEVYCFTGLRSVISECERSLQSHEDASRTVSASSSAATSALSPSPLSSGSPRSCSEQARSYVDDVTIEDLSGYMEYYLYIPKKMSHMAEMMYT